MKNSLKVATFIILFMLFIPLYGAAQTGPTLEVISQSVDAGQTVTVPVNYFADGNAISTIIFSVDFDETNLDFDPASTQGFPWPDAITVNPLINPFTFSVGITYDASDTDGELDFNFSDINPPLMALPEGDIVTITFTAGNPAVTTDAPVVFSTDPSASFGSTAGASVPGVTFGGSVLINVICTPSTEVCDNVDNDCDGSVDEDMTRPTTCGVGECGATGEETCSAGVWGDDTCTPGSPSAEVCDSLDNDCDGATDEDLTRPTNCGVGECAGNTGEETCTAGTWGADTCDPLAGATTEGPPNDQTCGDTLDNDCDGQTDLGDADCLENVETNCFDGVDNDGDGLTDCADPDCNGVTDGSCSTGQPGICSTGTTTCQSGASVCVPDNLPQAEVCDNVDNNCDGAVDDNLTRPTTCGVGECAGNTGEETCSAGTWGGDTCDPLAGVVPEVCEGSRDEDCDGIVDNGCSGCIVGDVRACGSDVGECVPGTETCIQDTGGGIWSGICVGEVGPSAEVCDNLDNDCDGSTDENLTRPTTCGVGECAGNTGEETCTAGTWGGDTCDPLAGAVPEGPPGDATCGDTLDNDCNDQTDSEDIDCQEAKVIELFDWGFYIDGTTYCLIGPCDFDVDDTGNITGPEDLPSFIDTSGFDFTAGLGSISITLSDPGNHSVVMFVDHDIDEVLNGFINETGIANGSPEMGQTWELDEPGGNFSGQNGSAGFPYFGDIFFDNFLIGMPDNQAFFDAIDDQTLTPPDDVSMAMGWDFELVDGQTATMVFLLSDTSVPQGFHLVHRDPDSDANIYFSSSLEVSGPVQCTPTGDSETICNGIDDDCDDLIDEDFQPATTTCGVGECAATGQKTCIDGVEGDTCTPGTPSAEVCDNLDNDCDGSTDEDLTRPTTCGVGECAGNTGIETCSVGTWGGDTCDPVAGATAEVCDNLDNDCDGSTDEDLTRPTNCGVGECTGNTGEEACTAGTWGGDTCDPFEGAVPEGPAGNMTCEDGLDNDCDGLVDTDETNCEKLGADVFLTKLETPGSVKVKEGKKETKKIKAFGMTDTIAQKATVNLTVNRIDAVTVNIHPESRTKSLKPGHDPKKFKFNADISCNETGTWKLHWTATIDAPQNADTSNDTMTASTMVTCEKQEDHDGWKEHFRWEIKTFIWNLWKKYFVD